MNNRTTGPVLGIALLSACLFAPSSVWAAGNATEAKAASAAPTSTYADVAPDLARLVEDRATYLAKVQPRLWAAGYRDDREGTPWERQSRRLAELLWQLRLQPSLQSAQEDLLLAPVIEKSEGERGYRRDKDQEQREERRSRVRALENLVDRAWRMAYGIQKRDAAGAEQVRTRPGVRDERPEAEKIAKTMAQTSDLEPYVIFALTVQSRLGTAANTPTVGEAAAFALWRLRDRAEDSDLAFAMLADTTLRGRETLTLLQKLVDNPAEARDEFAHLAETTTLRRTYAFLTEMEGPFEVISQPIAALLPEGAAAIENPGVVPLAAQPVSGPAPGLAMRRLTELLPKDMRDALKKNKNSDTVPALPFVRPGERLYLVQTGGGRAEATSIITNTPLARLKTAGPAVAEYTPELLLLFAEVLSAAPDTASVPWRNQPLLLAAACSPQELADHLSSLMVMKTERERSLFGPFDAYAWKPKAKGTEHTRQTAEAESYPKDLPGVLPRLVKTTEPVLFTALAPQADAAGLARLMGPIRGLWAHEGPSRDTPWLELRYTPQGPDASAAASATPTPPLGKAPILSLDKAALENIVARERFFVTLVLAQNIAASECSQKRLQRDSTECTGLWAGALARTEKLMADLVAKGFISPIDAAMPVYALDSNRTGEEIRAALQAIIDDMGRPASERSDAVYNLARKNQKKCQP